METTNENIRIDITENGTTTLATAGKYCDRNIDVNADKVYEAGQQSEYDRFWDLFQQNGARDDYAYGFSGAGWNDENFKPKYDIVVGYDATGMFRQSRIVNLKQCLESCGVVLDFLRCSSAVGLCVNCSVLKVFPKVSFSNMKGSTQAFYNCPELETVEVEFGEQTVFSNTFYKCNSLTHLIVTGVIGQNGLDLHWSTKLTHDSLMSIINALQTKTSGTWTVTLGSENLAKLTDAEKAIATQKGWTLL